MSIEASSSTLLASLKGALSLPTKGPISPTREVEKNTGSISAKSRSACMRCMSTDPTIPRQPTKPTRFIVFPDLLSRYPNAPAREKPTASAQSGDHGVAHLPGPHLARPRLEDVAGAIPLREHLSHR